MSETTCRHCGKAADAHNDAYGVGLLCGQREMVPGRTFTPGPTYEALTARVALLEEALRPFAEAERAFSEGQVGAALKHLAGSDFARAAGALGTAQTKETGR